MTLKEILPEIPRLSLDERFILLEALTRSMRVDLQSLQDSKEVPSIVSLRGALKTDRPAPTDEEIDQIRFDYLMGSHK